MRITATRLINAKLCFAFERLHFVGSAHTRKKLRFLTSRFIKEKTMANLSVKLCGVTLKNPVIAASGTYGFGREFHELYDIGQIGGVSTKGMTLEPRLGNPVPRIAESRGVILNAVGLQNPGVEHFIESDLAWLKSTGTAVIANVAGKTLEDYEKICARLDGLVDMIELNISCPNVKSGGVQFGTSCESVGNITKEVRAHCKKPLIVKLSPNVTDIASIAQAAEAEGADAVSMINTLTGMKIDINTRRPIIHNNTGGLSGAAVFPVAVRMVWQVSNAIKIPIIGMGGITTWEDAVEMLIAGATALQIGTVLFSDPYAPIKIAEGVNKFLDDNNISSVTELTGTVRPW